MAEDSKDLQGFARFKKAYDQLPDDQKQNMEPTLTSLAKVMESAGKMRIRMALESFNAAFRSAFGGRDV